ncbi:MAG: MOSC domain-containing protein [Pseudomonadota bacterium]
MPIIEHIFIAPEKRAEAKSVKTVNAIAECGLEGDRYSVAKNRKNSGQQITFIEVEQIERFISETGLLMGLHEPRRNIVTRGVDLNALVGKRFFVGECVFYGVELCEPCAIWAKNTHKEVVPFFVHRGGLNARIVRGGVLSVGSSIEVESDLFNF